MKRRIHIEDGTVYLKLEKDEAKPLITLGKCIIHAMWGENVGDVIETDEKFAEEAVDNDEFALLVGKKVHGDASSIYITDDFFVWKLLSDEEAKEIITLETPIEMCRLYDDDSETVISSQEELDEAIEHNNRIALAVGFISLKTQPLI